MHRFGEALELCANKWVMFELGVFLEEMHCFVARDRDEARIAEMAHGDIGESGLARPKESSWTADFEISFGEYEAVGRFGENGKTIVFFALFAREQETE